MGMGGVFPNTQQVIGIEDHAANLPTFSTHIGAAFSVKGLPIYGIADFAPANSNTCMFADPGVFDRATT